MSMENAANEITGKLRTHQEKAAAEYDKITASLSVAEVAAKAANDAAAQAAEAAEVAEAANDAAAEAAAQAATTKAAEAAEAAEEAGVKAANELVVAAGQMWLAGVKTMAELSLAPASLARGVLGPGEAGGE